MCKEGAVAESCSASTSLLVSAGAQVDPLLPRCLCSPWVGALEPGREGNGFPSSTTMTPLGSGVQALVILSSHGGVGAISLRFFFSVA